MCAAISQLEDAKAGSTTGKPSTSNAGSKKRGRDGGGGTVRVARRDQGETYAAARRQVLMETLMHDTRPFPLGTML